jgi:hypothetical protein
MYNCPHCQQPGISVLRRSFLGPAIPATCVQCGRKIGVPYGKSVVAALPFLAAIVISVFVATLLVQVTLCLVGAATMVALFLNWVPLIKR